MDTITSKSFFVRTVIMVLFLAVSSSIGQCQYTTITYGAAGFQNPSAGVYRLTDDNGDFQVSAVWYDTPLNPLNSFDLYFNVHLGCHDETGADGMAFVLSPAMGIGDGGANMGAYINENTPAMLSLPSMPNDIVLVEFDTWDNGGSYCDDVIPNGHTNDHIDIKRYNSFSYCHASAVNMGNMEDNLLHTVRIKYTPPSTHQWDWDAGLLEVFYYPVGSPSPATPVVSQGINIYSLTGEPSEIYWGWTAATGGNKNQQFFSFNGTSTPPLYTTSCITLPLTLLDFNVSKGATINEALINWAAVSTDQHSRIELYRSTDAQNWQLIYVSTTRYDNIYSEEVADELTSGGIYYYKIEMIDQDGIRTRSPIKSLSLNEASGNNGVYKLYLSEGKQKITLSSFGKTDWNSYRVSVTDVTGREILHNLIPVGVEEHRAEISLPETLAEGIYIVRCIAPGPDNIANIQRMY